MRTDDLESVRVERAVRRVRSDVAAHITSPSTVNVTMHNSSVLDDAKCRETASDDNPPAGLERRFNHSREDAEEAEMHQQDGASTQDTDPAPSLVSDGKSNSEDVPGGQRLDDTASTSPSANSVIDVDASDHGSIARPISPSLSPSSPSVPSPVTDGVNATPAVTGVGAAPSTPLPSEHLSRIPRSQSADPDKAARLSRVYTQSATSVGITGTETTSTSASATEDESSVNTSRERRLRKKHSKSTTRVKERSSRKVQVSDFEMMRVLGKGCAGKVLLVRHKSSSDLYALKAITKRHVLAHQELQHTLTEQAVLRRMAAEGTDPFVVKLWWSFHDKENLFLVMVRSERAYIRPFQNLNADMFCRRISTLGAILLRNWHAGVALGATVPASMPLRLLRASRAYTQRVSSIVTSSQKTSSSPQMATSYLPTSDFLRSSRGVQPNTSYQVLPRRQVRHTG